jgi:putative sigma-54 modulation protein
MQISVTFRHMEPNQATREYAEEKVSRVKKYLDNPLEANVILSIEKHRHIAEVNLVANGFTICGKEETENIPSAIDLVMDKIERQIRKRKGKQNAHKSTGIGAGTILIEETPADRDEDFLPQIVKSTRVILKPMSIDEAIFEMDQLNKEVLIFSDPESTMVNIIIRRSDGDLELVETIPE